MPRKYETLYILKHDSSPEKTDAARKKFQDIIEKGGGLVIQEDNWGKKKLAFDVKKYSKGVYILLTYLADPTLIAELERNLKINSEVIRYLTVLLADKVDLEAEQANREKWLSDKQRREAEMATAAIQDSDEDTAEKEDKTDLQDLEDDEESEDREAEEDLPAEPDPFGGQEPPVATAAEPEDPESEKTTEE